MINWIDIPGETGPTFTKVAELSDTGQYRRLDTNIAGSTPSNAADVVVQSGIYVQGGGIVYPAKTLSSTEAGQWYVDDVAVSGETGSTYVIRVQDIGKPIRCGNSDALTCWHPLDEEGTELAFVPWANALNGDGNQASPGEPVAVWGAGSYPDLLAQDTEVFRPVLRQADNSLYLEFDGINSGFRTSDSRIRDHFNTADQVGAVFAVSLPAGGGSATYPPIVWVADGGASSNATCLWLYGNGTSRFRSRRTVGDALVDIDNPSTTRNSVHTLILDPLEDYLSGSRNGIADVAVLPGTGNAYVSRHSFWIGRDNRTGSNVAVNVSFMSFTNSNITPASLARLERFAMLTLGDLYDGADIPLQESP